MLTLIAQLNVALLLLVGCNGNSAPSDQAIKIEIQQQLDKCVRAVNTKDIDLYMALIPEDFIIKDEGGDIISREQQQANTLRDWALIDSTFSNQFVVDSIQIFGDSTIAYTSQKWERTMFRQDGITTDTIVTTQKHRETWKKTAVGWLNYEVAELGGEIFINGKLYKG